MLDQSLFGTGWSCANLAGLIWGSGRLAEVGLRAVKNKCALHFSFFSFPMCPRPHYLSKCNVE